MEKKTRISCNVLLVAFVYFDEKEGKVLFDVLKTMRRDPQRRNHNPSENWEQIEDPEEKQRYREEEHYIFYDQPNSIIRFLRSDRKRAYNTKIKVEPLQEVIQFFRFEMVSIVFFLF